MIFQNPFSISMKGLEMLLHMTSTSQHITMAQSLGNIEDCKIDILQQ